MRWLGGMRRLGGLGVRAKASECMELGMWGQICETSETGGTGGRAERAGKRENTDLSLGVSLPQFLEKRGDLSLLFEA